MSGFSSVMPFALLHWLLTWVMLLHVAGPLPQDLGLQGQHLRRCSGAQHCAQLRLSTDQPLELFSALNQAIDAMPRMQRIVTTESYVHVVATSFFFGFADDLELALDQTSGWVELRSESRLGESDFGVNRRRLAELQLAADRSLHPVS